MGFLKYNLNQGFNMKRKIIVTVVTAALGAYLALPKEVTAPLVDAVYCVAFKDECAQKQSMDNKKFWAIIISLVLTNANFLASIKVLESKVGDYDRRLSKIENKIWS